MCNIGIGNWLKYALLIPITIILLITLPGCGKQGMPDTLENVGEQSSQEDLLDSSQDLVPIARPIGVTIDNSSSARPQSGLNLADLVYEVPVEGGVTRYVAVFFHRGAKTIGPIRSARPYLIDLSREWDAVYIHCGQSPQAQTYFAQQNIAHINEMFHPSGFWRDKSRIAPYNLYTDTNSLWEEITKLGWDREANQAGYHYRGQDEDPAGLPVEKLSITYPYGRVGYEYAAKSGSYLRFLNQNPYQDLTSGEQLAAENVLIQQVPMQQFDSVGRLEVGLLGQGKAWLFSGGRVQEGTWRKDYSTSRTRFYDQTGAEMSMGKGRTWIQLISGHTQINYQ